MSRPYRGPLVLAVMTLVGLVLALLAEGVWDVLSWGLLLTPVAVMVATGVRGDAARAKARTSKHS